MLAFEVSLLTGRYVATSFNDRGSAEWPPHPARLFSALVATHFESLDPPEDERDVLRWLEQQGPPEISAPEPGERDVVTVFVPVNDTSVVGSLDEEKAALDNARQERDAARTKGGKVLAKAEAALAKVEARFVEAARKAIAPVPAGKEGKDGPARAESLLPERRTRQPRTFPSVAPADMALAPRVVFAWPSAEPSAAQRATLDTLAARVVRLGHSSSFVSIRLCADQPAATWIPDNTAHAGGPEHMLRVVEPGQLEALCSAFVRQPDAPGRVMPAAFQRYVRPAGPGKLQAPGTVFGDDWTVLRRIAGRRRKDDMLHRLPSVRTAEVARTMRNAMMKFHGSSAPEILSGHRPSGEVADRPHLAYVPLPFVGNEHADGSILGAALVFPRDATQDERRIVYRALAAWEQHARRERSKDEHDEDDRLLLPLHLGKAGTLRLEWLQEEAMQANLRAATWCAEASVWASATPVALDRNPGDLRAEDPKKQAAAYAEAEASIAAACEHIGLPRPARVTVVAAAPLAGGDKVRLFPAYRAGRPPVQRVLTHATLAFDAPVRGPILLGAGRYFGLGLFRPLRDHG